MSSFRYLKVLLFGVVATVLALTTMWAFQRTGGDPVPSEDWMESAAQAPEVEGEVRWDLPVAYNDRVEYWINFLKGRNHDKTKLWLERKSHYEPMILGKLRERGMPEDLIYLAMIESGFSPRAYSKAHASGIWQFIAETGRRYGLQISGHLDERRDPVKATDAALDYLQKLHRQFGSWYLAAAAYNSGEGRVQRILNQRMGGARGDDELFWKIDQYLPRETRDYVPLMLAAAHIGKEPEKYGFRDLQPQAPMRYDGVEVPGGTALRSVARAAGVDIGEVQQLNPQFLHDATPPGRVMTVRIPEGRNEVFALNFERVREEERVSVPRVATASASTTGRQHTVRKGETLSHIARHYGTTVRQIQAANSGLDPNRVRSGQRIRIPGRQAAASRTSTVAPGNAATAFRTHQVRRGESLWTISRRYGVTVRQIQSWNNLGNRSTVLAGQRLRIRA